MQQFSVLKILIQIYLLVLSLFTAFRLVLLFVERSRINFNEVQTSDIFSALLMGLRFDLVISSYLLALPALLLFVFDSFNLNKRKLKTFLFYWIFILFTLAYLIAAADIPYFGQFFTRFSITAFEWLDNASFVFSMILQEPKYIGILIPFIILIYLFYRILKHILNLKEIEKTFPVYLKGIVYLLCLTLIFFGIRGRFSTKSPIRVGTAYFSNDAFLNQLGLNPVFTLLRSYLDSQKESNKTLNLMDENKAIDLVKKSLNVPESTFKSPIARLIEADSISKPKQNVVLILMESMSAAKMTRHGNQKNLTPFLDSLSQNAQYFNHIYTAGTHTFNGIFSTLFSFPALYRRHAMKQIQHHNGISSELKKHGYHNIYFCTHDEQFDNVGGFLMANDFQDVISQKDYPLSAVKTTLGVPDDFMFEFAIPILNEKSKKGPFFATIMTASDHGPYYIPDYFKAKNEDIKDQIVEYADWSIQKFFKMAAKTNWYKNTLFVLIADHGASMNVSYEIPLNYFHSPLIFFQPGDTSASINSNIGGQIDVFPSIMGKLNLSYINNTLGIDLNKEKRPYIFINGDDKLGVLDTSMLLILRQEKNSEPLLFNYAKLDKTNYANEQKEKVQEMENYGKANLQVYQYLLKNNLLFEEATTDK
ncbi:MAG: alkaline phosphatase family protein [Bacteroidetes bacterium]|nr:MAG: alkaline phosphatase family protein [Bacteroidota bacterium]